VLGDRIVLDDARPGAGVAIYARGKAHPVVIPRAACPEVFVRPSTGGILCMGCGARPPLARLRLMQTVTRPCSAPNALVTATFYDGTGRVIWTRKGKPPTGEQPTTFAADISRSGDPMLHFASPPEWRSRFFVLGSGGFEEKKMVLGADGYEEANDASP
jgi:hypothetical protein